MKKELSIGDKVLIFKYIPAWGYDQDYNNFIEGVVIKKETSDDISEHGSPWYVINYTVLGENQKEYFGNYNEHILGSSFFMSREDYINLLRYNRNILKNVNGNENVINMLKKYQNELLESIKKEENILDNINSTFELCLKRRNNEKK